MFDWRDTKSQVTITSQFVQFGFSWSQWNWNEVKVNSMSNRTKYRETREERTPIEWQEKQGKDKVSETKKRSKIMLK